MTREIRDYLNDIITSIDDAEAFTEEMDFEDFITDKKTTNAVIRSLEIIGEAVKRIPDNIKDSHPELPWKYMAGMRDKLIHGYHGVDLEIVWKVVKEELPPLKPMMQKILDGIE